MCALSLLGVSRALAAQSHFTISVSNVQVSHDAFPAHSEPAIAENPKNPLNLVAGSKFFTDPAHYKFKIGTYYTTDGGKSWKGGQLLPGFENYTLTSDISFAFAANGTVYACVLGTQGDSVSGVYLSKSTDGGKTWSQPATVFVDTTGATFSDKPWLAVDTAPHSPYKGSVYVVWNLDGTGAAAHDPDGGFGNFIDPSVPPTDAMVVSRSTDGGVTWTAPRSIFDFDNDHFALGAIPAVGPQGDLRIAFLTWVPQAGKTINQMDVVSSLDGGYTFSTPKIVVKNVVGLPNHLPNSTFRNLSMPGFAVSPADDAMVVVWADMRNGDADILAVSSLDHGKTWTRPYRVNHDRLGNGKDQFQPEVAVSPNGVFTASWFDRRHDPANRLIDVDIAQSTDDGRNFGTNFRVTKKSWDPAIDAPLPGDADHSTFIGDYQALAVDNHTVHPLWNDTQNGASQQIRTAVIAEQAFKVRRHA